MEVIPQPIKIGHIEHTLGARAALVPMETINTKTASIFAVSKSTPLGEVSAESAILVEKTSMNMLVPFKLIKVGINSLLLSTIVAKELPEPDQDLQAVSRYAVKKTRSAACAAAVVEHGPTKQV